MANHKWKDNTCVNCGLRRKLKYWKLLMAVTQSPPYDHYQTGTNYFYTKPSSDIGSFQRPDCLMSNNTQ